MRGEDSRRVRKGSSSRALKSNSGDGPRTVSPFPPDSCRWFGKLLDETSLEEPYFCRHPVVYLFIHNLITTDRLYMRKKRKRRRPTTLTGTSEGISQHDRDMDALAETVENQYLKRDYSRGRNSRGNFCDRWGNYYK